MSTDRRLKTLVVGLDAACWPYLLPMLRAGRLPALQKLMDQGISGTLISTLPALTPTAWATIVTGKNPGKHGVYDMLWRQPGTYDFGLTNATLRAGTPFWKRLNQQGIRVGLVNVPFSHPPEPIDGFMVCGFGTPVTAQDVTSPADVYSWVEERFGPYQPRARVKDVRGQITTEELLSEESLHQKMQAQMAGALARKYDVDVLVINLMLIDHANHYAQEMSEVEQAISESDADLQMLIQDFEPDNVMVLSDHGSRRVKGDFLLGNWLSDHGYFVRKPRTAADRSVALDTVLDSWLKQNPNWNGARGKVLRRLLRHTVPLMPQRPTNSFWNHIQQSLPGANDYVVFGSSLDFARSSLFPGSTYSGNLYFNLSNREPNGVVSQEDKPALEDELIERLSGIVDPETGQPLFCSVNKSSAIYSGFAVDNAPELVIDGYDSAWNAKMVFRGLTAQPLKNSYFLSGHGDKGWHSKDGVLVFSGASFLHGQSSRDWHLADIASTLLHLYEVPIPEDYDGQVMADLLEESYRQAPVRFQKGDVATFAPAEDYYSAEESEAVLDHLRALGYVD